METLERLRKRINTAEELQSVVKTMKGIAAAAIRQFERAVESLKDYDRAVQLGLRALVREHPERVAQPHRGEGPAEGLGLIVFGSDQGFCGRFNILVAEAVAGLLSPSLGGGGPGPRVLAVGRRVLGVLEGQGLEAADTVAPASSLASVGRLVDELLIRVLAWREEAGVERVVLAHNEALGGASYEPRTVQLYPVDLDWLRQIGSEPWPGTGLPGRSLGWEPLFSALVREHVWVQLYRAAAESLASENASRLASMQAAERNIDERLGDLTQRYRMRRQTAVTEELMDIISGFTALGEESSGGAARGPGPRTL